MAKNNMRTLSFEQRQRLHARLGELLVKGVDGFWHYKEGHVDASVAADLEITSSQVSNHRLENFGRLQPPRIKKQCSDGAVATAPDEATHREIEFIHQLIQKSDAGAMAMVENFLALQSRVEALEAAMKRVENGLDVVTRQTARQTGATTSPSWRDLVFPASRS